MKLPRDLSADDLISHLKKFGYSPNRQTGSHIRLTTQTNGTHHITIPNHASLRTGTFSSILNDVALHFKISRSDLIDRLFGMKK